MKQTLFIYRGIPGSGKTTAAYRNPNADFVFEADQYFTIEDCGGGFVYEFDPSRISDAHKWCLWKTIQMLQKGHSVAVANTFTRLWEMQQYVDFAKLNGIDVVVFRMTKEHSNVHSVPENTIKDMKDRFMDYEGEILV